MFCKNLINSFRKHIKKVLIKYCIPGKYDEITQCCAVDTKIYYYLLHSSNNCPNDFKFLGIVKINILVWANFGNSWPFSKNRTFNSLLVFEIFVGLF